MSRVNELIKVVQGKWSLDMPSPRIAFEIVREFEPETWKWEDLLADAKRTADEAARAAEEAKRRAEKADLAWKMVLKAYNVAPMVIEAEHTKTPKHKTFYGRRVVDATRCAAEVWDGYETRQCARKRGHGPHGAYCKQHADALEE